MHFNRAESTEGSNHSCVLSSSLKSLPTFVPPVSAIRFVPDFPQILAKWSLFSQFSSVLVPIEDDLGVSARNSSVDEIPRRRAGKHEHGTGESARARYTAARTGFPYVLISR